MLIKYYHGYHNNIHALPEYRVKGFIKISAFQAPSLIHELPYLYFPRMLSPCKQYNYLEEDVFVSSDKKSISRETTTPWSHVIPVEMSPREATSPGEMSLSRREHSSLGGHSLGRTFQIVKDMNKIRNRLMGHWRHVVQINVFLNHHYLFQRFFV